MPGGDNGRRKHETTAAPAPAAEAALNHLDIAPAKRRIVAMWIARISELVQKHPDEAVAVVRRWLSEGRNNTT